MGKLPVIHLHGLPTDNDNYFITEKDLYCDDYRIINDHFARELYTSDAFVFVGYSMNDPDIRNIYLKYRQTFIDLARYQKSSYLVSPPSDLISWVVGKEVWDCRNVKWIPLDARSFFFLLKSCIEDYANKYILAKAKKNFRTNDDEAFDDHVAKLQEIFQMDRSEVLSFLANLQIPGTGDLKR
jgi:hypothetical protein